MLFLTEKVEFILRRLKIENKIAQSQTKNSHPSAYPSDRAPVLAACLRTSEAYASISPPSIECNLVLLHVFLTAGECVYVKNLV